MYILNINKLNDFCTILHLNYEKHKVMYRKILKITCNLHSPNNHLGIFMYCHPVAYVPKMVSSAKMELLCCHKF